MIRRTPPARRKNGSWSSAVCAMRFGARLKLTGRAARRRNASSCEVVISSGPQMALRPPCKCNMHRTMHGSLTRRQFLQRTFAASALVAGAPHFGLYAEESAPAAPVEAELAGPPRGPWRRLFLDATVVEQ